MQDILKIKLQDYIISNHPDLLIILQEERKVTSYLNEKVATVDSLLEQSLAESKPDYIIEELCMEALISELPPSKFNYLCSILEEEFETDYYRFKESGTLTYEVINLINVCTSAFEV